MKIEKIFPETLLELIRKELDKRSCFEYIEGVQPFLMKYDNVPYYVYIKNLSSAFFKDQEQLVRNFQKETYLTRLKNHRIFLYFLDTTKRMMSLSVGILM